VATVSMVTTAYPLVKSMVASAACLPSAVFSWVVSSLALDEVVAVDELVDGWFEQPLIATTGRTSKAMCLNMKRAVPSRRSPQTENSRTALTDSVLVNIAVMSARSYVGVPCLSRRERRLCCGTWISRLRPLWRCARSEKPDYSDTVYVTELIAAKTVNTMPDKTIDAVADHGVILGDTAAGTSVAAQQIFDELDAVGVDLRDVFLALENNGVDKFKKSWQELLEATQDQLGAAT
jgi:hypothetical protein